MCHSGSHLVARYGARLPPAPPLVNSTSKRHLHYLKPVTLNSTRMPSLKPSTVTAFSHEFHTKEMSQGQPIKPQADQLSNQEGIKYGDVFDVTSGLASKTIAPRDVAIMLEAETEVLRKPLDTGANAVMYSAATANLRVGVVGPDESNEMVEREDVAVSKSTDAQGKLVVNEAIADHMLHLCPRLRLPPRVMLLIKVASPLEKLWRQQSSLLVTNRLNKVMPLQYEWLKRGLLAAGTQHSGLGTRAQAAATFNDRTTYCHNKITISDISSMCTRSMEKLPTVKTVKNEDAEEMRGAKKRNKADVIATAGGVVDTMATAANGSTALFTTLTPVIPGLHCHHGCLLHRTNNFVLKAPYVIPSAATVLDCFPFSLLTSQFNTHYAKYPINKTMSQQQPQQLKPDHSHDQEPIKYSDVFNVTANERAASFATIEQTLPDMKKKVVGQYIQPEVPAVNNPTVTPDPITVGEAFEMADVTTMLPRDKAVTPEDADKVVAAELRNNPYMSTAPGGVTASMTAARLNENSTT
ncbi:hypothetical protein GOBAR_AA20294 [Gossypium barbadense]|uniref:SMP domain-containing protein n=1 Tax=Gossypium barbadense TaxID=3634 RepID=A0A2P5XAL3_GOSBA|nr:hypothetical protein GOBAR_AA20294 [Gossypium barbadense]